jgi:hypothetical protein
VTVTDRVNLCKLFCFARLEAVSVLFHPRRLDSRRAIRLPAVSYILIIEGGIARLTDQSKQTEDGAEDLEKSTSAQTHPVWTHLDNQDLDEQLRVGSIGQGGCRACYTDGDTAEKVAEPDSQSCPEDGEAW